jgi:triphosphoribosyl-dephospho-CoA synthetase
MDNLYDSAKIQNNMGLIQKNFNKCLEDMTEIQKDQSNKLLKVLVIIDKTLIDKKKIERQMKVLGAILITYIVLRCFDVVK